MRKGMVMYELWLPVVGHEETHKVSNLGRIKRLPMRITTKTGIIRYYPEKMLRLTSLSSEPSSCLTCSLGLVHRVVALAFLPNPQIKPEVNHKDGNQKNNLVNNLEWATTQENVQHAWDTGLHGLNGMAEEQKQKISASLRGRKLSKEHRDKVVKTLVQYQWLPDLRLVRFSWNRR